LKGSITVSGSKEFTKFYRKLKEQSPLKQKLDTAIDLLKKNPNSGDRIKANLWPAKYIKKYCINNLYRYSLGSNWRMIYTLVGQSDKVNCVILETLDHKEYDNLFGYKTS